MKRKRSANESREEILQRFLRNEPETIVVSESTDSTRCTTSPMPTSEDPTRRHPEQPCASQPITTSVEDNLGNREDTLRSSTTMNHQTVNINRELNREMFPTPPQSDPQTFTTAETQPKKTQLVSRRFRFPYIFEIR